MSTATEDELAREAKRVLRKLLGGARLQRGADGRYAVVIRARGARHAKTKFEAPLVAAMRAKGWLANEGDRLFMTAAGEGWFVRAQASSDPYAAQHRVLQTQRLTDDRGCEHTVAVDARESPLAWMRQRGLVDAVQCQAGERLRRDFTLAQLSPRLGVDWTAPIVRGRRAPKTGVALTDAVLAAKQRFAAAMRATGPGLSDVLFDVCCHLRGLEDSERALGWPRASAKVVLKIALDRLAGHYGMLRCAAPARIRTWTKEGETMEGETIEGET